MLKKDLGKIKKVKSPLWAGEFSSIEEIQRSKIFSNPTPLPLLFYERNTLDVAQDLLGKVLLVRSEPGYSLDDPRSQITAGRIVETEAYREDDPASHSFRGETPRSSVMFGEPGVAYVYFIYGIYEMLNFVTEPKGTAGAVLIRALDPIAGQSLMLKRRNVRQPFHSLMSGPGKLCRAMGIKKSHNRESLMGPRLYVIDDGFLPNSISKSPRVGISLAQDKLWRFFITDSPYISRVKQNKEN